MKVIIFFGHHKVGSTALQGFLARNSLQLLKSGILYPAVESEGLTHLLSQALDRKKKTDLRNLNVREPHNALGFKMLFSKTKKPTPPWHGVLPGFRIMLNTISHQVAMFQPHTLVLCSEVFANFGAGHHDLIEALRYYFKNDEVELYCTLRRPDEYLSSWFGQRMKFGNKLPPLPKGAVQLAPNSIHFDYKKMVKPWVDTFSGSKLHLRNYSDVMDNGGSIKDFMAAANVKWPARLDLRGPKNSSLPRESFDILRQAMHDLSGDEIHILRAYFQQSPAQAFGLDSHKVEIFGSQVRQELYEQFVPIHEYLSTIVNRPLFFSDIEKMNVSQPISIDAATQQVLGRIDMKAIGNENLRSFLSNFGTSAPSSS